MSPKKRRLSDDDIESLVNKRPRQRALEQFFGTDAHQSEKQAELQSIPHAEEKTQLLSGAVPETAAQTSANAEVKSQTKLTSTVESIQQVEKKTESHAIPQSDLHAEPKAESQTKMKVQTEQKSTSESIQQTEKKLESNVVAQSNLHAESKAESQTKRKSQTKKESQPEAEADPAAELFVRAKMGAGKLKMEDIRKRRTYWLTDEEIAMIDKLAEMTGKDKYEVVGLAVQSMYYRLQSELKKK